MPNSYMHPELIKAQLRMAGSSPAQIARDLQRSHSTVSRVISGQGKSTRIARRICEVARLDPHSVWPGKYPEFRVNPVRYSPHQKQKEAA